MNKTHSLSSLSHDRKLNVFSFTPHCLGETSVFVLNGFALQVIEGGNAKQKIFTYDSVYNTSFSNMEDTNKREELVYHSTVRYEWLTGVNYYYLTQ